MCVGLGFAVAALISNKDIGTLLVITQLPHAGEELRNWRVFPIELDSIAAVHFGGADRAGRASAPAALTSACGGPQCSRGLTPSRRGLARVCASLPPLWTWMKAGIDGLAHRMQLTSPSPSPTLAIHRNNSCGLADMAGTWWRRPLSYIRFRRHPASGIGGANCSARTVSRAGEGPVFYRHAPQLVAPRILQGADRGALSHCVCMLQVRGLAGARSNLIRPHTRLCSCLQTNIAHVTPCMLQRVWPGG